MPVSAVPSANRVGFFGSILSNASGGLLRAALLGLTVGLASCGGGGDGGTTVDAAPPTEQLQAVVTPTTDIEVRRFLTQASFGPNDSDIARVKAIGYAAWIDEQFNMPVGFSHLASVKALAQARGAGSAPIPDMLAQSWWTHAITAPNQLRQRVAFALSEIFVVSTMTVDTHMAAAYLDMLTTKADANYRNLLEAVTLSPAMGHYLSHLSNRKEDLSSGRVPDENFAREVMQLFSIGLHELDNSGRPVLVDNRPVETYGSDDIKGLAKAFTGFSWHRSSSQTSLTWWKCFWRTLECQSDDQLTLSMSGYENEHSLSAKTFLGVTIPAQTVATPAASLRTALDRLASHQNTAPFISKQLIQKLVTSNPSPQYVADITDIFRTSGGNLRNVVKAILLHAEARSPGTMVDMSNYGKVREPLLRLTHLMRALPHSSLNYASSAKLYMAEDTSDPGLQLGQTPMRSPSVFNFYRPGYTPAQTSIAEASLVAPEMQLSTETTVLGYANFVADILHHGWGYWNAAAQRPDIRFELGQWDTAASSPTALLDTIAIRLIGRTLPEAEATVARNALNTMPSATAQHRRWRVQAAIQMVAVSPQFIVQQ